MEKVARKAELRRGIAEGVDCINCLDSGYVLDTVETTFGEYEDVSLPCICRKPVRTELSVIDGGKGE